MSHARRFAFTMLMTAASSGIGATAQAEPFAAGRVMRLGFTILDFVPRAELANWDVFELTLGFRSDERIGSFTTKLYHRGTLLGTFTGADPGPVSGPGFAFLISRFRSPESSYRLDNPAVIDMASINDGTINGWLEFTIAQGRAEGPAYRTS